MSDAARKSYDSRYFSKELRYSKNNIVEFKINNTLVDK